MKYQIHNNRLDETIDDRIKMTHIIHKQYPNIAIMSGLYYFSLMHEWFIQQVLSSTVQDQVEQIYLQSISGS